MSFAALTEKSRSVFTALGGWPAVAEGVTSRLLFLVCYLPTGDALVSSLVAVGGVLVFAVVRVCTDRKWWQAATSLVVVGLSAALAGGTGHGAGPGEIGPGGRGDGDEVRRAPQPGPARLPAGHRAEPGGHGDAARQHARTNQETAGLPFPTKKGRKWRRKTNLHDTARR
jgi:hypothetical protein